MRKLKDMVMAHSSEVRVSTTAGHTIHFKPNTKVRVPALAVPECLKHGAKPLAAIRGTETSRLHVPEGAGVKSEAHYPVIDEEEIEEIDFDPADLASDDSKKQNLRNQVPYTETENLVRQAIEAVLDKGNPEDFTEAYLPKTTVLNEYAENMTIKAEHRDRVWDKMQRNGEITEAMLNDIFGEDDDDDAEAAA